MAVKGPNGWDPSLDVYDVPPSVEKSLPPSSHHAVSRGGAGASGAESRLRSGSGRTASVRAAVGLGLQGWGPRET